MTTKELLNLSQKELLNMTEKELRKVVSTLRSTARKRYERIEKADIYSESAVALWKSSEGGSVFPTVKGMETIQLLNEFKRYKTFLISKTSTVRGARKSQKNKADIVKDITGVDLTSDSLIKFYSIYDSAKNSTVGGVLDYKKIMSYVAEIYDLHPDWSEEKILKTVEVNLVKAYENENTPLAIYPSLSM